MTLFPFPPNVQVLANTSAFAYPQYEIHFIISPSTHKMVCNSIFLQLGISRCFRLNLSGTESQ